MRSEEDRIGLYDQKTAPTTVGLKVASGLAGMKSGFAVAIGNLVPIEQQIQGFCNGANVPTIQYPFYLNFGREIWGLRNRGIDGGALSIAAQSLHDKYVLYGLSTAHLAAIAMLCFNLTVT